MPSFHHLIFALVFGGLLADVTLVAAQPQKRDPTPQDYVERNGGGATIARPGELVLDGHRISCGKWATILDPNLNDYAASYPQFVILNMRYVASVPTAVQLWIFSHECAHLFGEKDENKADCRAVQRGRGAGWLDASGMEQVQHRATRCRPRRRCRPLQSDAPLLSGGSVREA
jgi:hypothetical protein